VLTSDDRVELIEGDIVSKSPANPRQASVKSWLSRYLILALSETGSVRVGNPVHLGEFSEPEPDLIVLKTMPDDYLNAHPRAEDVLLLVEVADASLNFDLGAKRDLYARHAVSEYWVVDTIQERVFAHRRPVNGVFQQADEHGMGEAVSPMAFPAIQVSVRELFRNL
jgi:Uma2 family endonuclease